MRASAFAKRGVWVTAALIILALVIPQGAYAADPVHVVKRGENLYRIALRYGTSISAIAKANGIHNTNHIYTGQRLTIPGKSSSSSGSSSSGSSSSAGAVHTVKRGENLTRIAARYGTTVKAIVKANGLSNPSRIYTGQRLTIPGKGSSGSSSSSGGSSSASGEKWIEVDLGSQRVYARQGDAVIQRFVVSTGTSRYPTPAGKFRIYAKYRSTSMSGPGYNLKGVPHTMYFYRGYALHGTYWHNNFGRPMSHGCINLTKADAKWLYEWAPKGTLVKIHY
jgi:lipoprotein-anchoring transpeptidase ErfK/SrfK